MPFWMTTLNWNRMTFEPAPHTRTRSLPGIRWTPCRLRHRKVVTLRKEVREGRSFGPDEFAIALEQVVAGTTPADYRDPEPF